MILADTNQIPLAALAKIVFLGRLESTAQETDGCLARSEFLQDFFSLVRIEHAANLHQGQCQLQQCCPVCNSARRHHIKGFTASCLPIFLKAQMLRTHIWYLCRLAYILNNLQFFADTVEKKK